MKNNENFLLLTSLTVPQQLQIKQTLEATFSRKVSDDYFSSPFTAVLADPDFTAVAIIKALSTYHYLDKFAIHPDLQSQGIGKKLWTMVIQQYPTLIWRSRKDNPFNQFYLRSCSGFHHIGIWHIFWQGITVDDIPHVIELVSHIPESFYDK
ncbi:MAG: GNAT family N-acetyltransferase [Gammaproteobacteria bacterium]